jgi:hypothetical protein
MLLHILFNIQRVGDDKLNTSSMQNELIGIIVVLNKDNKIFLISFRHHVGFFTPVFRISGESARHSL